MVKEKSLLKKTGSILVAIFMLFSLGFNLSNNKVEAVDMASYVRNLIGTPAKEWGVGTGTQCVELPKYYIEDFFGLYTKTLALGNGNEMYKIVSQTFPNNFQQIDYYEGFEPKAGDIISYHSSSAPAYGHAAIVYEVTGSTYKIAEQWAGSNTVRSNTKTVAAGKYGVNYTIIGVARPIKPTSLLLGDANCDKRVTIADAVAIIQALGNPDAYSLSADGKNNADCCDRGDGVNANDAKAIEMIEAGYITANDFPIKSSDLK